MKCKDVFAMLAGRLGDLPSVIEAVSDLVLMVGQSRGLLERVSNPGQVAAPPFLRLLW